MGPDVDLLAFPARPVPVRKQVQHGLLAPPGLVIEEIVLRKAAGVHDAEVRGDARPGVERRRLAAIVEARPHEAAGDERRAAPRRSARPRRSTPTTEVRCRRRRNSRSPDRARRCRACRRSSRFSVPIIGFLGSRAWNAGNLVGAVVAAQHVHHRRDADAPAVGIVDRRGDRARRIELVAQRASSSRRCARRARCLAAPVPRCRWTTG